MIYEKTVVINGAKIDYKIDTRNETVSIMAIELNAPDVDYVIPDNIDGAPVVMLWTEFAKNLSVNKLILPETERILVLRQGCFENSGKINEIHVSGSVDTIPAFCFIDGRIKKIIFSNPEKILRVEEYAFSGLKEVSSFTWPRGCSFIPKYCFSNSKIKKITGVEGITEVEDAAFFNCELEEMTWPTNCKVIPFECFSHSKIKHISNIHRVERMGEGAFEYSQISKFAWPAKCAIIPARCFKGSELKHISFDYSARIGRIESEAFSETKLKEFDTPETNQLIVHDAMNSIPYLETVIFPKDQHDFPIYSFKNCPNLKKTVYQTTHVIIKASDIITFFLDRRDLIGSVSIDATCVSELEIVLNDKSISQDMINDFIALFELGFETNVVVH